MHYYSHNIGDFNNATIHLSVEEECMYHRALAWYYSNEKPLPKEREKIYRYLRATTKKLQAAVDNVLDDFFTEEADGFHQSRCDAEIAEYQNRQAKAVEAGKASAEARRKASEAKASVEQDNNDGSTSKEQPFNDRSTTVQPTNNHKPITNNQNNKNIYAEQVSEVFEFWKTTFGKNNSTILSKKRKDKITERLKDGYTVERIKQAIYNCSKSDFHTAGGHTDIELICRDVEHLDRFLDMTNQIRQQATGQHHANNQPANAQYPKSDAQIMHERNMADYDAWLAELDAQSSQSAAYTGGDGGFYDVEAVVPVENEKPTELEFGYSNGLGYCAN